MTAKPRKSVVQNIIKNLLEMEIPEIQTASRELGDWIKQLEQHSFKLQHYATEIENWATEEEETDTDTVELTDLIKDLEATLSDMRTTGTIGATTIQEQSQATAEKLMRGYGRTGRNLRDSKAIPRSELQKQDEKEEPKQLPPARKTEEPVKKEPARTPQGILIAKDNVKAKAKAQLPTGSRELVVPASKKVLPKVEEVVRGGYMTPEGFMIRKIRP